MRRAWEALTSLRTTALLLAVLFLLLLANVVFPQAAHEPEAHAQALARGGVTGFLVGVLGLGNVVTGLPFLGTMVLFFVNLAAVLADRTGATIRRVRFTPPTGRQLEALREAREAARADCASDASLERADEVLQILGYRTARVGADTVWGVKNRLAPLGFPIFHASFFLLCAGALQIYLTRSVVTLVVAEGQTLSTLDGPVLRRAAALPPIEAALTVERVDLRLEGGQPTELSARLALDGGEARRSSVNRPATWADLTVLVQRAGIAPLLRLQDRRGYTLDRVVVPVASPSGLPARIGLAGGAIEVVVEHVPVGPSFPARAELPRAPVSLRLRSGQATVFDGVLRPGEAVAVGDLVVQLDEVRYWVGLRLIRERGGWLLVAGFAAAVAGIAWRLAWFRREAAVTRQGEGFVVVGRAEFAPARAADEVLDIARLLSEPSGRDRPRP